LATLRTHEQLARVCVEDNLWRDARVAAADDHGFRLPAGFGELLVTAAGFSCFLRSLLQ
jgi:hypothetical protein